ncbi:nickel-dependent hydrogenases B-type cytochrome subunit family protein [Campylobacter hyointestinalis subsp. hyointestinalis]|nr:cytochrome b/b6 domain-containing protein [Campylobacter hyointestinalis]CUU90380.1 nickel-dependent hydrogenases B-type cytochrome subunit family protein [Campylobacter hyointestinalis subsp. hyointestinalis]CUU92271.1 nickel-dependent hydrogenases B-type cytochrome subunit family protein [Campylobacter hyointestinalis subsp. hyointestinalis]
MIKSYIWSFGARFSHIVLIFSFIISYILSEFDSLLYFHAAFGVVFGVAVIFRIVWGFIETKYSKFSDFKFSGLGGYFLSFFGKKEKFIGHNPASSIAIIIMLSLGFVCVISGIILYGID